MGLVLAKSHLLPRPSPRVGFSQDGGLCGHVTRRRVFLFLFFFMKNRKVADLHSEIAKFAVGRVSRGWRKTMEN